MVSLKYLSLTLKFSHPLSFDLFFLLYSFIWDTLVCHVPGTILSTSPHLTLYLRSSTPSSLYVVTHVLTACKAWNFTCCAFYWNIFRIIRVEKEIHRDSFPNQPKCLPHWGHWYKCMGQWKELGFSHAFPRLCDVGKSPIPSEPQFYPLRHGGHTTYCIGLWRIGGTSSKSV